MSKEKVWSNVEVETTLELRIVALSSGHYDPGVSRGTVEQSEPPETVDVRHITEIYVGEDRLDPMSMVFAVLSLRPEVQQAIQKAVLPEVE